MGSICCQRWRGPVYGVEGICGRSIVVAGAPSRWGSTRKPRVQVAAGIHIDRRSYFEHVLKRQLELEAREAEALNSCPVECVREIFTVNQFENVLHKAEQANNLVLVDFYSSSCGACKYLLPQVINLCKKGCEDSCSVDESRGLIFVKHNIRDDYDELTARDRGGDMLGRGKASKDDNYGMMACGNCKLGSCKVLCYPYGAFIHVFSERVSNQATVDTP